MKTTCTKVWMLYVSIFVCCVYNSNVYAQAMTDDYGGDSYFTDRDAETMQGEPFIIGENKKKLIAEDNQEAMQGEPFAIGENKKKLIAEDNQDLWEMSEQEMFDDRVAFISQNAEQQVFTDFINGHRGKISFVCPETGAFRGLESYHLNAKEDRRWKVACAQGTRNRFCHWLPPNRLDEPFVGICPDGHAVSGIYGGFYNVPTKDRKFSVLCCNSPQITNVCHYTRYLNEWDKPLKFTANFPYVITGIISHHNNFREDRRYILKVCKGLFSQAEYAKSGIKKEQLN